MLAGNLLKVDIMQTLRSRQKETACKRGRYFAIARLVLCLLMTNTLIVGGVIGAEKQYLPICQSCIDNGAALQKRDESKANKLREMMSKMKEWKSLKVKVRISGQAQE